MPQIPSLSDVSVANLRGAAQIPTEDVTPDQPYSSVPYEIGDIDLVSISARFDVRKLISNFQQSFMGPRLKTSWKDETLASPVFARLELQRRFKQRDGSWGPWVEVSRTKNDQYEDLLEELPLNLEQSQFGVDMWMSQFMNSQVQADILQPEPYLFTISRLDWLAPDYLEEALKILDRQEQQDRREQIEERRERRESATGTRRGDDRRPATGRTPARRPAGREVNPLDRMMGIEEMRTQRTATQKERTVDDVKKDFQQEFLGDDPKIESIQDPLLVWVHDDSLDPGKTYQYRIRIGVFNPIAGKNWFVDEQTEYKDQLVLWSDFTEPTNEIEIPQRVYMFPMDVIAGTDAATGEEGIRVQVAKFYQDNGAISILIFIPGSLLGMKLRIPKKILSQRIWMSMRLS